jgi:MFS family permease
MNQSLLKQRDFRLLWIGQLATIFGNRFSELALPWIVLQHSGSPWQAGLVAICSQIAPLLLAIPSGVWIEKKNKLSIAFWAEAVRMFAMGSLAIVAFLGYLNPWTIAVVLFLMGLAGLFFRISIHSIIPSIVGRKRLLEAHNNIEGADALGTTLGPTLAGLMFAALGAAWTLTVETFAFFISLVCIQLVKFKEKIVITNASVDKSRLGEAIVGLKYLVGHSAQRMLTMNSIVLIFSTYAVELLAIIHAKQVLQLNIGQTGILFSAAGIGNILGVFLISKIKNAPWNLLFSSVLFVSGTGVLLLTLADSFYWALVGMFLFDGALSMGFVLNGSARQAITPDRLLARISGAGILLGGMMGIGGKLYAGGVAEANSSTLALAICGALLLLGAVIAYTNGYMRRPLHQVEPIELQGK